MVKVYNMLASKTNIGGMRDTSNITSIVIHGSTDEGFNGAAGFQQSDLKKSVHYYVNKRSVHCCVSDDHNAFSIGAHNDLNETFANIKNSNSISIMGNFSDSLVVEVAAEFIAEKMKEYNIDIDHVVRHFDTNTECKCPSEFVDSSAWGSFKEKILEYYNK